MPQYLVTLNLAEANPLLPIDKLGGLIRDVVLPSLGILRELKSKGRLVTGGYPTGQPALVLILDANSEEEVHEILEELPMYKAVRKPTVAEFQPFEALEKTS